MGYDTLSQVSYESLICYTDNFSEGNYIGHFQFGKYYHGKIIRNGGVQHVVVKIWEDPVIYNYLPGENEARLFDELGLLGHHTVINHPAMVTLCKYCFDGEHLGIVYELKALDSLYNLIPEGSKLPSDLLVFSNFYMLEIRNSIPTLFAIWILPIYSSRRTITQNYVILVRSLVGYFQTEQR